VTAAPGESPLAAPHAIDGIRARNRIARSGTAEVMAGPGGEVTDDLVRLYERLAAGGAGIVVTGGAYVEPRGRGFVGVTGSHADDLVPGLSRISATIKERGAVALLQLYHCGRQGRAPGGVELVAPSAVPDPMLGGRPRALRAEEIEQLADDFAASARRARDAGFDGVQILAANGYLVHQFLSPHTNRREDRWGGDLEGRARFLLEIVRRSRALIGDGFLVTVKLCVDDHLARGLPFEEGLRIALMLDQAGVDALEPAVGMYESGFVGIRGEVPVEQIMKSNLIEGASTVRRFFTRIGLSHMRARARFEEAFLRDYAADLRGSGLGCTIMLGGGMRTPQAMEAVLRDGIADVVCLSRPLVRDPGWPNRILAGDLSPARCEYCNRCLVNVLEGRPVRCLAGEAERS